MQVSVYIATSLDGFIARKNGELDWLSGAADSLPEDEDYGFQDFFETVDCLIMGRKTFEMVADFDEWAYGETPAIVLSRHLTTPPDTFKEKVEVYQGDLNALVERLKKDGAARLYVDGGQTIQAFIREGLVTDITVTKIPVLIGEGLPLFGHIPQEIKLHHQKTETFPSGFVKSLYSLKPKSVIL